MKQCEKIDLNSHNRSWKCLPNMQEGRFGFNPCLFSGCVYVCGQGSLLVEALFPPTDTFLPFQFQLPESRFCCLFVCNHLLTVHSENYISQFSAGQSGELLPSSQLPSRTRVSKGSNSQPVVNPGQNFYFIVFNGKTIKINLETGAEIQRFLI